MAGIALTQSNLLSTQIGQDDAWSANAPASAPAADISWSHYEDIGHATGAAIRKRIVGAAQSTAKTAFKPIQQAVDIPIQVGKQGTENALARALPGIMRRATPLLRKKVEQRLRRLADGEEDINAWRRCFEEQRALDGRPVDTRDNPLEKARQKLDPAKYDKQGRPLK